MTDAHDPHASKLSPDDPRLKPRRRRGRPLQKGPAIAMLAAVVVAVAVSVVAAVEPREKRLRETDPSTEMLPRLPPEVLEAPDVVPLRAEVADAGAVAPHPAKAAPSQLYDVPSRAAPSRRGGSHGASVDPRKKALEDRLKAQGSDPFVYTRTPGAAPPDDGYGAPDRAAHGSGVPTESALEQAKRAISELSGGVASQRAATSLGSDDGYLPTRITRPRSPYELKPGTVIPAVLQTAINSDLPGPVFAKVRENVYDSITHEYLLIPQNSTLVATYDSRIAWGQQRVLLCWERLIYPDGGELQLGCMPAGDLTGAAGLTDEVDEHWMRLAKGAALASLLSAGTAAAGGNTTGYNPTVPQQFARGAASEFGRAGEQVTRRELLVQPTITVRPGWAMNVLVTRTMVLEPYADGSQYDLP